MRKNPTGAFVGIGEQFCGGVAATFVRPGTGIQLSISRVLSTSYVLPVCESQQMSIGPPGTTGAVNLALNTQPTIGLIFVNTLMQSWPVAVREPRLARATYQLVFTPSVGMKTLVRSGIGS